MLHRDLESGGVIELQLHVMWDGTMHASINIHHQYDKSHNVSEIIRGVMLVRYLDTVTRALVSLCADVDPKSARARFHRRREEQQWGSTFCSHCLSRGQTLKSPGGSITQKAYLEFMSNQNAPYVAYLMEYKGDCHPSVPSQTHVVS